MVNSHIFAANDMILGKLLAAIAISNQLVAAWLF